MTYTYKLSRRLASSHDTLRTLRPLVLLLLALLATACSTGELIAPRTYENDRPSLGWVHLNLTTPNANDGVATVVEAAARGTYQLQNLSGYTAQVTQ